RGVGRGHASGVLIDGSAKGFELGTRLGRRRPAQLPQQIGEGGPQRGRVALLVQRRNERRSHVDLGGEFCSPPYGWKETAIPAKEVDFGEAGGGGFISFEGN